MATSEDVPDQGGRWIERKGKGVDFGSSWENVSFDLKKKRKGRGHYAVGLKKQSESSILRGTEGATSYKTVTSPIGRMA